MDSNDRWSPGARSSPGEDARHGRPARREAPRAPALDLWTLEQAALELGTSIQGLVLLLREHSIAIRRFARAGRTLSGISGAELEVLRGALEIDRGAPAADAPASGLLEQRLRETERALEEARLDQEVARSACEQLARVTAEAEASERRVAELVGSVRRLEAELARSAERIAALEGRERELGHDREIDTARRAGLERELAAAREVEAANGRYADQVEHKLAAANETIEGLRRRPA
jgi:hypothetical protein